MTNRPDFLESKIIDVEWGIEVRVVKPCNLYGCKIGDRSFIGPFVEIQKGAVVGRNCRVQSHSFICSQVTVEDDCFIGHGVLFTNDKFTQGKPSYDADTWQKTHVGSGTTIGSGATILPVRITSNCVIGAGAVVTKDLTEPGVYVGNPARILRKT
jgi:acetyltransferase-like isoleucine patch superfamily enzyme